MKVWLPDQTPIWVAIVLDDKTQPAVQPQGRVIFDYMQPDRPASSAWQIALYPVSKKVSSSGRAGRKVIMAAPLPRWKFTLQGNNVANHYKGRHIGMGLG